MFRMMALAVGEVARGQGLSTGAIGRLEEEQVVVAGPRFGLVADLVSCMRKGGAGFYVRQGWAGGGGSWSWRTGTLEGEGPGVVADQGPVPAGGSERVLAGKKQREELVGQLGRYSLWEQGRLGTGFCARQCRTGKEVTGR